MGENIYQASSQQVVEGELKKIADKALAKLRQHVSNEGSDKVLIVMPIKEVERILHKYPESEMELQDGIEYINRLMVLGINSIMREQESEAQPKSETPKPQDTYVESRKQIRPEHYGGPANVFEPIKVITAWGLNFNLGNAVKYIARAGKKTSDPTEDLRKAKTYIDFELDRLDAERKKNESIQKDLSSDIASNISGRKMN